MRYATDHAFRTAFEARVMLGRSDSAGVSRLRRRIVFERLLARLVAQAPGEWVLKDGFALELRLGNVARSTKDADFEWRLGEEDAVEMLLDAAGLDLGDRFTFALERADEETDLPGGGQRWRIVRHSQAGSSNAPSSISRSPLRPYTPRSRSRPRTCSSSSTSTASISRRSESNSTSLKSSTPTHANTPAREQYARQGPRRRRRDGQHVGDRRRSGSQPRGT